MLFFAIRLLSTEKKFNFSKTTSLRFKDEKNVFLTLSIKTEIYTKIIPFKTFCLFFFYPDIAGFLCYLIVEYQSREFLFIKDFAKKLLETFVLTYYLCRWHTCSGYFPYNIFILSKVTAIFFLLARRFSAIFGDGMFFSHLKEFHTTDLYKFRMKSEYLENVWNNWVPFSNVSRRDPVTWTGSALFLFKEKKKIHRN